jgi:hypothetical protein
MMGTIIHRIFRRSSREIRRAKIPKPAITQTAYLIASKTVAGGGKEMRVISDGFPTGGEKIPGRKWYARRPGAKETMRARKAATKNIVRLRGITIPKIVAKGGF